MVLRNTMNNFVCFVLLVLACCSSAERLKRAIPSKCGEEILRSRIIGGETVPQCTWPYSAMVSLRFWLDTAPSFPTGELTFCAGALVNSDTILTAAVCVEQIVQTPGAFDIVRVVVGDHDTRRVDIMGSSQEEIKMVSAIKIHPGFNSNTTANNVAVVKLKSPIAYDRCKLPACLPEQSDATSQCNQVDDTCKMAAWGSQNIDAALIQSGKIPKGYVPNAANLTIYNKEVSGLIVRFADPPTYLPEGAFIGRPGTAQQSCYYDWGGVVVCKPKNKWILKGLIGTVNCALSPNLPMLVVDIAHFSDWIIQCDSNISTCPSLM